MNELAMCEHTIRLNEIVMCGRELRREIAIVISLEHVSIIKITRFGDNAKEDDIAKQRLSQRIEETINVVSMGHHGVYSQSEYLVLSLKEDNRKKFSKDNK
ncbi:hypothetical protein DPMN_037751 [Dreissena polymorpha]|uniref:Uncharacterized protein n=1 Tax=Dreissena polymorpha TaxID=45954 RepID=A0A9D4MDZ7_DREPO|nr:hypothetical protein DPMN_037751 [Dreissena polymorpha]